MGVMIILPTGKADRKAKEIIQKGRQLSETGISVLYVIPPTKELIDIFEEGEQFTTINFYPFLGYWTSKILHPLLEGVEQVIVFRKRHYRVVARAIRLSPHPKANLTLQTI